MGLFADKKVRDQASKYKGSRINHIVINPGALVLCILILAPKSYFISKIFGSTSLLISIFFTVDVIFIWPP